MPETPIAKLHDFGATFHQTTPLKRAGHTTAEAVADLVAEHQSNPENSPLADVSGMGQARIDAVCSAVERWRSETTQQVGGLS